MSILAELFEFLSRPEKILAAARAGADPDLRRADRAEPRLGRRALHLHAFLTGRRCAPRHFRLLSRQRRRAGRATARSSPRRRKSASRARSTTRLSRATRCATAWRRPASTLRDVDHVVFYEKPFLKFERLLETYLAFAPRGFASFRMAMPLWIKRKAVPEDRCSTMNCAASRPTSTGTSKLLSPNII